MFLVKFLKNKLCIRTNMVTFFKRIFKVSTRSWFSNHKSILSRSLGYNEKIKRKIKQSTWWVDQVKLIIQIENNYIGFAKFKILIKEKYQAHTTVWGKILRHKSTFYTSQCGFWKTNHVLLKIVHFKIS